MCGLYPTACFIDERLGLQHSIERIRPAEWSEAIIVIYPHPFPFRPMTIAEQAKQSREKPPLCNGADRQLLAGSGHLLEAAFGQKWSVASVPPLLHRLQRLKLVADGWRGKRSA